MTVNNDIAKDTAAKDRQRFTAYLESLISDGLIEQFIDLDDPSQSKLKPWDKRADFLVEIGQRKIAIELKSRILGDWDCEPPDVIGSQEEFDQILADHYRFKDVGKNVRPNESVWADPSAVNSWKSGRLSNAKKQLENTAQTYGQDIFRMVVYSHQLLPTFIDKTSTAFVVPQKWLEFFTDKGFPLFNEVHLPLKLFKQYKGNLQNCVVDLMVTNYPSLRKSINELPAGSDCRSQGSIAIYGVRNYDLSEAFFVYNGKLKVRNSCIKPLPSDVLGRLTKDRRMIELKSMRSSSITFFYPEIGWQFESNPFEQIMNNPELQRDPDAWARREAHKVIDELSGCQRANREDKERNPDNASK